MAPPGRWRAGWTLQEGILRGTVGANLLTGLAVDVTVVKDATASYSDEEMHTALDVNIPNYASAVVTTTQIVDALASVQA